MIIDQFSVIKYRKKAFWLPIVSSIFVFFFFCISKIIKGFLKQENKFLNTTPIKNFTQMTSFLIKISFKIFQPMKTG